MIFVLAAHHNAHVKPQDSWSRWLKTAGEGNLQTRSENKDDMRFRREQLTITAPLTPETIILVRSYNEVGILVYQCILY